MYVYKEGTHACNMLTSSGSTLSFSSFSLSLSPSLPLPRTGLKLKLQDQPHPSFCYTYALSPFIDKPVLVDWKIIVNDDIQSQHIRCHTLQPGDKVKDLISSFRKALAKAVVLINTQDNYTLAPEFTEGVAKSNYPIVILTKSDGNSLVEMLDKYYGQSEVLARLDVEGSAMELQQQQQEQGEVEASAEGSIPSKKDKGKSESHGMENCEQL